MSLNDIKCKTLKPKEKPYKVADEKGLYLEVMPSGSKYWRLKYRFSGKENRLAIGVYPAVSLKEARDKREIAKKQLADGIDPSNQKKIDKLQKHINSENTFEAVAREWHSKQAQRLTARHSHYVLKRLEADAFPAIGFRSINQITAPELLATIQKIEKRGALDVAHRVLQTSGQVFRYAIATGRAERDISADLRGALITRKKVHNPILKENEIPEFLEKLKKYDGDLQTKLALKFLMLTFVRTTELRKARWDEFNFEAKEWHIPLERMKGEKKHIVPLSKQSLEIINHLKDINNNEMFVFPNKVNPNKTMSENTMLGAMYRMGYHSRATPHGLRGTASTILNEKGFNRDHIEIQLAHSEKDSVRASYNHAQYLPERHKMMQWWADYLDKI
jgi:integrase